MLEIAQLSRVRTLNIFEYTTHSSGSVSHLAGRRQNQIFAVWLTAVLATAVRSAQRSASIADEAQDILRQQQTHFLILDKSKYCYLIPHRSGRISIQDRGGINAAKNPTPPKRSAGKNFSS